MGCASSSPMVQTAGSDMLKAATHVADDATKTAEDAVQGVKDSLGKTLESAKETVATTVEDVKHEVENTIKEKAGQLDEAKNSLMGKLHLGSNAAESAVAAAKDDVAASVAETEMEAKNVSETVKQSAESVLNRGANAANEVESVLARTGTETDSLRTSTPEPEIERAMANTTASGGGGGVGDGENEDSPPTPMPTYSELENLSNELLSQQAHTTVNDTATTNDPLMMMTAGATAAPIDNTTTADSTSTTDVTKTTIATANSSVSATTALDSLSNAMHITPLPIATATSIATAIAATTASAFQLNQDPLAPINNDSAAKPQAADAQPQKSKAQKREEKMNADRAKQQKLINKLQAEKRPGTTEWEKYADMLAIFRKYNPQDAFRRGGTLTKFNAHHVGGLPIREKALHGRGDDDSSDTTSTWGRGSPGQRSSARLHGRVQRALNRPNSANHRSGSLGRRTNSGRKFDYNPHRPRLNAQTSSVSSGQNWPVKTSYGILPLLGPTHSPSQTHESVKSHVEMRSQHLHLGINSSQRLEPLHRPQPEQLLYYTKSSPSPLTQLPLGGRSSMQPDAMYINYHHSTLTLESSNTSLSSLSPYRGHIRSYKSIQDLTTAHNLPANPPARNTSSFLSTPRTSPFGITKSHTDLYFSSAASNKENQPIFHADVSLQAQQRLARDKSPHKVRGGHCEVCSGRYIKT